jgi:hypothetical protein
MERFDRLREIKLRERADVDPTRYEAREPFSRVVVVFSRRQSGNLHHGEAFDDVPLEDDESAGHALYVGPQLNLFILICSQSPRDPMIHPESSRHGVRPP